MMSPQEFVDNYNNMPNGGTWQKGQAHFFRNASEARSFVRTNGYWETYFYLEYNPAASNLQLNLPTSPGVPVIVSRFRLFANQRDGDDSPRLMWHMGASLMTTEGLVNFEGMLKNGAGFVFRINADVTSEVQSDSYYAPVRRRIGDTTKKITEVGAYWEGGGSFQMTHEFDSMGNLIDENYQINVGYLGFGVQVNWDSNDLKDVRFGLDGGFGLGAGVGVTENVQIGLMYVQNPK